MTMSSIGRLRGGRWRLVRRGPGVLALCLLIVAASSGSRVAADETSEGTLTARVKVNPFEVTLTLPNSVSVGERFASGVVVYNNGDSRLRNVVVQLVYPVQCLNVMGSTTRSRGVLQGGSSFSKRWWAVATPDCQGDNIIVMASVSAVDDGQVITAESSAGVLTVE